MPISAYDSPLSRTATEEGSLSEMGDKKEDERVPYSQQARLPPWKLKDLRFGMGGYITVIHVLALYGLPYVLQAKTATLFWSFALWMISGFGITGGAHRLWSHRSYTAGPVYRCLTMLANSVANQGSIWHWARDHRTHHFHSETVADPHDAIRGFWFAHIGWLYLKKDKRVAEAGAKVNLDDLRADGFVMFQKKWDPWWNILWCFVLPALVAAYGWGEAGNIAFFVPCAVRYVWVLHMTWLVNSAAHLWGERPYDPKSNPAENPLVAIASIGEGWHNWHHKYPFDYAASEYGILQQFNPTKMVIDFAAACGSVTERKRGTGMWKREKVRLEQLAKAEKQQ